MKKMVLGGVAALALMLCVSQDASAHWAYRNVSRYDPSCGHVVVVQERYWVTDVVIQNDYYRDRDYRDSRYYDRDYRHHDHHDHHGSWWNSGYPNHRR